MNSFDDNNNIFICGRFQCCGTKGRKMGVYLAGILVKNNINNVFILFDLLFKNYSLWII
ncbi:hypothetical protein BDC45DRAFT_517043 [Circinella umbellata]|nr:hypothetical protein BDC45DRAFT_517043 [Circinella umbellata]